MYEIDVLDGTLPVFGMDTETTSKDPEEAHIITYGLALSPDEMTHRVVQLPEEVTELDEDNVAVHGYSVERIREEGDDRADAILDLFYECEALQETAVLVGHNVGYDLTVLNRELVRLDCHDEAAAVAEWAVLDTNVIWRGIMNFNMGTQLFPLATSLGVDPAVLENAHTADADARVSVETLLRTMQVLPGLSALAEEDLLEHVQKTALRIQQNSAIIFGEQVSGWPVRFAVPVRDYSAARFGKKKPSKKKP